MKKTVEIIHPITGRATHHALPFHKTLAEAERAMEYNVSLNRGTAEGIGNLARLDAIRRLIGIKNDQR